MEQSMAWILVILGSFISLLLMVNAYFTRETLLRVVKLEIRLENNSTKNYYIEKQVDENTKEIKDLRGRMHTTEGAQAQILEFIESTKNL
jgi:cell division protein FtsB